MAATTLAEAVGLIPTTGQRQIVGVAGEPGAGKSTIAALLVAALGPTAALLPMDGYHLPQAELVELGRRDRMGAADTFDVDAFVATLRDLRSGRATYAPDFDRTIEEPVQGALAFPPELRTIVVEGNYLLHDAGGWERVLPLLDLSFFVEVEPGIRQSRLIERHVRFGKTPEAARAWALGPDEHNARVVRASAHGADHVIALR
ncbi:nucleoside/nucleotide kinase family protein [Glaciihabitans arcticus]|uniref:nucleoside/nucleotide kinase family protein n=1 Tax=Glaciihabitans arcticus TaxID=2668039 RepID=UPI00195B738B|nr:nucleoside/nucleotide kinase family protein [Glaciihabitans arcticus]